MKIDSRALIAWLAPASNRLVESLELFRVVLMRQALIVAPIQEVFRRLVDYALNFFLREPTPRWACPAGGCLLAP